MLNKTRIETRLKEIKMTKKELINKIDVSEAQFYNWLNNKHDASVEKIVKLCDILNLDLNDVIVRKKKENLCLEASKEEEILTIYKNLNEKEKNLLLALAKNVEILYNNDCVQNNKIKQARLAQLAEHLTLNQGVQGSNP